MLSVVFTPRVLVSAAVGLGVALGFYVAFPVDRGVAGVIAGTAGTVFGIMAGAAVPLLYTAVDKSTEHWAEAYFGGRDASGAREDLGHLMNSLGSVIVAVVNLLLAVLLAVTVTYTDSIEGTALRALLASATGLMVVGMVQTLFFVVEAAGIGIVRTLRDVFSIPAEFEGPSTRPTQADIDKLVGPATPHFAFQLRARIEYLVRPLPEDDPVRIYGEQKMAYLNRLGYASTKAELKSHEP